MSQLMVIWLLAVSMVCGFSVSANAREKPDDEKKKNVIFFISDDLNVDIGCYGHPQVRTPNLDKFRDQAVVFDHAYVQYPMCNASRISFLTGSYPTRNRTYGNNEYLRDNMPEAVTLPELFRKNGYKTISTGKVFHCTDPQSWTGISDLRTGGILPEGRPREFYWPPYEDEEASVGEGRNLTDDKEGYLKWMEWRSVTQNEELLFDAMVQNAATNRIEELAESSDPFFMAVGFRRPHDPYYAPERFFDMYPLDSIQIPLTPDNASHIPDIAFGSWKKIFDQLNEQDTREFIRSYYAGISHMDELFGMLLDLMQEKGLLDNTLIVFAGDNGFLPGDKGWFNKGVLFERACQVPLMIGYSGMDRAGERCGRVVEFVDIFPTISEFCGLENPTDQLDGNSLVPLLNNPESDWNELAVTWYGDDRSIRDQRYRYIKWSETEDALYDHTKDQGEFYNLVERPEYAELVERMRKELEAFPIRE
jgi:arylsulfatase A-like enzyme